MQIPVPVPRALVLVLISSIMISVEGGDQHEQACIPPGSNGGYSVSYNEARLPVEEPSQVQDLVLRGVTVQFINSFTTGPGEFCSGKATYSAIAGNRIDLFGYVYCGQGIDRQGCSDCLQGGAQVIRQNCPNSCFGAQACSGNCCIRFEGVDFCQVLP